MVKIRYHHLMCIPRYEGKGYSDAFCRNLEKVKAEIEKGDYILTDKCDEICKACPNKVLGTCITQKKVKRYDALVKAALEQGREPHPSDICTDCKWYDICKNK